MKLVHITTVVTYVYTHTIHVLVHVYLHFFHVDMSKPFSLYLHEMQTVQCYHHILDTCISCWYVQHSVFTILPTVQLCSLMAHLPADVSASNTILTFEGGTIGIISDSGRCVCVLLYVYLRTSAIVGVNMSIHAAYQYSVHTCSMSIHVHVLCQYMSIHGSTYYIMLIYIYTCLSMMAKALTLRMLFLDPFFVGHSRGSDTTTGGWSRFSRCSWSAEHRLASCKLT